MKKLICLFSLSLCCFVASAQPTSIGGITPGTTARDELNGLVKYVSDNVGVNAPHVGVKLKQLKDQYASVSIRNDVVYSVKIDLYSENAVIKEILIEKYGEPKIKAEGIREVDCKNSFGATFKRYQGKEMYLWPAKDGVQGEIEYSAIGECSKYIFQSYILRHVATFKAIEADENEKARKKEEMQRSKFDSSLRNGSL
jgi:hypothetical protein